MTKEKPEDEPSQEKMLVDIIENLYKNVESIKTRLELLERALHDFNHKPYRRNNK